MNDFPETDHVGPGGHPATPPARNSSRSASQNRPPPLPVDRGERLATLPRGDGIEMRVSLDSYKGHPYVSLRQWRRDSRNPEQWWPDPRVGCSVRIHEIEEVVAALQAVQRE